MKKVKLFTYWIGMMTFCLLIGFLLPELTTAVEEKDPDPVTKYDQVENEFGIRPLTIRLTGADHFLDFRYLVVDAEKARQVLHRNKKAVLQDQETGETYHVTMTKIGAMRGTTTDPKPGSRYFMLFTNSEKSIKRGNKVSVIIDECRVEDLTVE